MLKELHIENIAVIEKADITFCEGLNILTGETGAGKSIIIDSIGAVTGDRISHSLVRHGADKAMVTAVFDSTYVGKWLEENDIECDDEVIIQRKLTSDGKSSCRICGMPASLAQLKELTSMLIDIHGQNDGRKLLDEKFHLTYLDMFAGLDGIKSEYTELYKEYLGIKKEIQSFNTDQSEKQFTIEMLTSKIAELEKAGIAKGEKEEITSRLSVLRNFEKLTDSIDGAYAGLYASDSNALTLLENAVYLLNKAASLEEKLEPVAQQLSECAASMSDAVEELRDYRDSLDFSEEEYDRLENRLSLINRLERKYSADSDDFADMADKFAQELDAIQFSDEHLAKLEKKAEDVRKKIIAKGTELSNARRSAASDLESRILNELKDLNMPSVRFTTEFAPVSSKEGFDGNGMEVVRFLMSANAGADPDRISKIASGGELSRIMLAMKNVFSENDIVGTMIFDEIDTGVSGITAQYVAEKLYSVSAGKQVLCITHLPQIAAMADDHYMIRKKEINGKTYTQVFPLDEDGRKNELARLYGGNNITDTTIAAAGEQLQAAAEYKSNNK